MTSFLTRKTIFDNQHATATIKIPTWDRPSHLLKCRTPEATAGICTRCTTDFQSVSFKRPLWQCHPSRSQIAAWNAILQFRLTQPKTLPATTHSTEHALPCQGLNPDTKRMCMFRERMVSLTLSTRTCNFATFPSSPFDYKFSSFL